MNPKFCFREFLQALLLAFIILIMLPLKLKHQHAQVVATWLLVMRTTLLQ